MPFCFQMADHEFRFYCIILSAYTLWNKPRHMHVISSIAAVTHYVIVHRSALEIIKQ